VLSILKKKTKCKKEMIPLILFVPAMPQHRFLHIQQTVKTYAVACRRVLIQQTVKTYAVACRRVLSSAPL
jgi:hypothetical protein